MCRPQGGALSRGVYKSSTISDPAQFSHVSDKAEPFEVACDRHRQWERYEEVCKKTELGKGGAGHQDLRRIDWSGGGRRELRAKPLDGGGSRGICQLHPGGSRLGGFAFLPVKASCLG